MTALHMTFILVADSLRFFDLPEVIRKGTYTPTRNVLGRWHSNTNMTVSNVFGPAKQAVNACLNLSNTVFVAVVLVVSADPLEAGPGIVKRRQNAIRSNRMVAISTATAYDSGTPLASSLTVLVTVMSMFRLKTEVSWQNASWTLMKVVRLSRPSVSTQKLLVVTLRAVEVKVATTNSTSATSNTSTGAALVVTAVLLGCGTDSASRTNVIDTRTRTERAYYSPAPTTLINGS